MYQPPGPPAAPDGLQSQNRTAALLFILSGLLALGGLALLGIPGALLLGLTAPIAALFTDQRIPADGGWPLAILQTMLWPWVLVPAYLLAARHVAAGPRRVVATTGYTLLGGALVAVLVQLVAGRL